MLFTPKWFKNRSLNKKSFHRFLTEQNEIRIVDLSESVLRGPDNDPREYVARVGFFTEDMFYIDITDLVWYCRRDGNIWAEWNIRVPYKSPMWFEEKKRRERAGEDNLIDDFTLKVPMTHEVKYIVNDFTKELWTMHKLTSDKLL
jgi:hypothetical protein